ncbi:MAG TPA: DUF5313 family protein [Jatrophihabitantaceae bacterium]|nr:DUF5313 family protein [Jatrophihabitantaceae bacterium]
MTQDDDKVIRPNALQWLRYVYTGAVPAKNESWVLYDATRPTWVLRHLARYVVVVAPIVAAVLIFLPAPLLLRVLCCVVAFLTMMIFYAGFTVDAVERRVEKAGYTSGTATRLRQQRAVDVQRAVAARYRARRDAHR